MYRYIICLLLVYCTADGEPEHVPSLVDQLSMVPDPVQVCDQYSAPLNWYIYCSGRILQAVNIHQLYNDSKTYVDMPLKMDPNLTMQAFNAQFGDTPVEDINRDQLQHFINTYFSPPGSELLSTTPTDWQANPSKLMSIQDPLLREWALSLNGIWKTLCKRIDPTIKQRSELFSLIYVDREFIIPGGRFREFYYWDAYWIIKGLIASEMYNTTKSMIENLGSMVDRYGFVPNGGRIYYLKRSQPPMLTAMVYEYYEATNDVAFLSQMLPTLEKELSFWNNNRKINVTVDGVQYSVYQYHTASNVPRPESYSEDLQKAQNVTDKAQFWQDVASAAESGWDFSTRWFSDSKTIYHIETTKVIPVDLNSFVCWNLDILEYLYEQIGNFTQSEVYREQRARFRDTVNRVFYNKTSHTWYDFNLRTGMHKPSFYPSNTVPLFTGCYNSLNQGKSERLFEQMQKLGVFNYQSGIPTSLNQDSEEQWDFPNGFSNLNHMIIEGLRKSQNAEMQDQGFKLAEKWVLGNYRVWYETKHMWEKYNVIGSYPSPGKGGEYDVQDGFGWTNGVILDLLMTYNDRLRVPNGFLSNLTAATSTVAQSTVTEGPMTTIVLLPSSQRTTRSVQTPTTSPSSQMTWGFMILLVSVVLNW